jgi:serine/threonine protein kinase
VADVWGLGIVALHVANGEIPRRGTAVRELMRIVVAQPAPTIDKPAKWSPAFASFVGRCLVKDPIRRSNCQELLRHEWVVGVVQDTELPTRSDMRRRTLGRASLYNSPRKQQRSTVPPRAGAASAVTPAKIAAATPVKETAAIPAKQLQVGPADSTPPVSKAAQPTQEELVKELEGWKKLALKLMEERDAGRVAK